MMLWELDVEAWSDSGGIVQAGVCFMGEVGTGFLTNTPWEGGKTAPHPHHSQPFSSPWKAPGFTPNLLPCLAAPGRANSAASCFSGMPGKSFLLFEPL